MSYIRQPGRIFHDQFGNVFLVFHKIDIATVAMVILPHGAFHLWMTMVANEDAFTPIATVLHHFEVNLGYQRTGCVEHLQPPTRGFILHRLGHTMGTEDHQLVVRHLFQLIHKDSAAVAQIVHHKFVMHHFMAHVNGRTKDIQGTVHYFDSAVDTGTETTRISESDLHRIALRYQTSLQKPVGGPKCV
ncbi:hypothetical protein MARINON1_40168 [Marinobacter salarius]|nr:conserved hypothetical protein [Marinobacter salarius]VXB20169.1 hypothetical protein MARINON1_40168 [Marinobacter salarius]